MKISNCVCSNILETIAHMHTWYCMILRRAWNLLGGCTVYYVWEPRAFMTPPKNPLVYVSSLPCNPALLMWLETTPLRRLRAAARSLGRLWRTSSCVCASSCKQWGAVTQPDEKWDWYTSICVRYRSNLNRKFYYLYSIHLTEYCNLFLRLMLLTDQCLYCYISMSTLTLKILRMQKYLEL